MRDRVKIRLGHPGVSAQTLKVRGSGRRPRDRPASQGRGRPSGGEGVILQDEPASSYVGFLRDNEWLRDMQDAPIFTPTMEEFQDPAAYIRSIEKEAGKYGICKIQPPKELKNEVHLFSDGRKKDFHFTVRSQKMKEHNWEDFGDVDVLFDVAGSCTVGDFQNHASELAADHLGSNNPLPANFVETEYWRQRSTMAGRPFYVEYGNDVEGTAFMKSDVPSVAGTRWNLQVFGKDEGSVLRHLVGELPGITSPMLYIGAVFATFFWHVEDHFMHSINYMHCGAPKTWYGVPGDSAEDFETVCMEKVYKNALQDLRRAGHSAEEVHALGLRNLMKKTTMFSPKHLVQNGVPVYRVVQNAGEFVVTFPRSYHGGFSHGFNIGEAVNFGLKEWFRMGELAVQRYCWLRMQQILPHEELLVKEAVGTGAKYKLGGEPVEEDRSLIEHFCGFMNEQRVMRGILTDRGFTTRSTFSAHQSQPCYTCGRGSFLTHIVITSTQECHCLQCVCKEGVPGEAHMVINHLIPDLEALEGRFRRKLLRSQHARAIAQAQANAHARTCQPVAHSANPTPATTAPNTGTNGGQTQQANRGAEEGRVDRGRAGSSSGASPSSTSTSVNPTADPRFQCMGSGFSLHVEVESDIMIRGRCCRRRVLLSNWGGKTKRLVLVEEMLRAMGCPVDAPEDVDHVLTSVCEAVQADPKYSDSFRSGPPQRVQFINRQNDCEDGVVLGEEEVKGILSVLEGDAKDGMSLFVSGLWDNMEKKQ